MKKLFVILLVVVQTLMVAQTAGAQEITGAWSGELAVQGIKLPLVFNITREGEGYKATMDSPREGVKGIPLQETRYENGELTLHAPGIGLKYTGRLKDENTLEGTFSQGGMTLPLTFQRGTAASERKRPQTPQPPYAYYTEDVTFKNEKEGNLLAGTLAAPDESKDIPMLVMITGSGQQNRDEEIALHKPFLVIADYLAKKGIGTLRLDDRGIGGSERGKANPTCEDFAGDIHSAVNFLVAKGYKNIGLIGHSEGGMIAPMVGTIHPEVKFMILLAGPGIPLGRNMELQLSNLYRATGLSDEVVNEISRGLNRLIRNTNERETPYTNQELKAELNTVFSGVPAHQRPAYINEIGPLFATSWGRYFLKFKPEEYLSKIKVPVLALNGGLDLNVPAKENLEGIKQALTKGGNKHFEVMEFEGLNHLFQTAKTGSPSEYESIEETISPKVLEKISAWVQGLL